MGLRHRGTVQLETERLILRRFLPGDMEEIYNNCWRDYEVWRWTSYDPMPTIREVQTAAGCLRPDGLRPMGSQTGTAGPSS